MRVRCIIGVNDWERTQPQDIVIYISLHTDTRRAAETDDLADCVDYDQVAQGVRTLAEKSSRHTVEALAEDIARFCLRQGGLQKVTVKIQKPGAIREAGSAGVEIEREKD